MMPIIAIIISLVVVGLAFLLKHLGTAVAESDHHFWRVLIAFFVVYFTAAVALTYLLPRSPQNTANAETTIEVETVIRLNDV